MMKAAALRFSLNFDWIQQWVLSCTLHQLHAEAACERQVDIVDRGRAQPYGSVFIIDSMQDRTFL